MKHSTYVYRRSLPMRCDGNVFTYLYNRTTILVWFYIKSHIMLIFHPPCLDFFSDKTSLLFQHAISCAEKGQGVLFLSPSPLKQLPLLSNDQSQPQPSTLERIHLRCVFNKSYRSHSHNHTKMVQQLLNLVKLYGSLTKRF